MDRVSSMMEKTAVPDDMPIQAGLVSKAIAGAQQQVEAMNFSARKHVLEYDDVMNKQREVIYAERNRILDGKDIHDRVEEMMLETITEGVLELCPEGIYSEEWDWDGLGAWYKDLTALDEVAKHKDSNETDNPHELADVLAEGALEAYKAREAELGEDRLRALERQVMLRVIDTRWMEHLQEMDYLKEGIGLRAMGQRDPLVEYKSEAYEMFSILVAGINEDFLRTIMHIQVVRETPPEEEQPKGVQYSAPTEQSIFSGAMEAASAAGVTGPSPEAIQQAAQAAGGTERQATATVVKDKEDPFADVGRNDPCPCGSGKKYKKCHGANA
jgi:preprotein translocase subunit SecA